MRAPRPAPVRLTGRGRVALVLGVALLGYATSMAAGGPAQPRPRPHGGVVVVQPGQTVWSIARTVAPERDRIDVVRALMAENRLTDPGAVVPGQVLRVPGER